MFDEIVMLMNRAIEMMWRSGMKNEAEQLQCDLDSLLRGECAPSEYFWVADMLGVTLD
jgi:hypothetical protein